MLSRRIESKKRVTISWVKNARHQALDPNAAAASLASLPHLTQSSLGFVITRLHDPDPSGIRSPCYFLFRHQCIFADSA